MNKIYCRQCFAELPDYAHFCHLCGASQSAQSLDLSNGNTPPPANMEGFNTEFAPASAGRAHSEDATLPSKNMSFQAHPEELSNNASQQITVGNPSTNASQQITVGNPSTNASQQVTVGNPSTILPETPPGIASVKLPEIAQGVFLPGNTAPMPGNGEYNNAYYAAQYRKEDPADLSTHPTKPLKKDENENENDDLLLWPGALNMQAPERADHRQPQMQRADHRQPQMQRADHKQPQMQRADHRQPQMQRADHQQPQMYRAQHTLPQTIHVVHKQTSTSRAFFAAHKQAARYSLFGAGGILLVGLIVLLSMPLFKTDAQVNFPATLAAVNANSTFPGGSVTLHGTRFTPGATVAFTTDGDQLAQNNGQMLATLSSLASATTNSLAQEALLETTVRGDGTFDMVILIPQTWQARSTHKIQAAESSTGKIAYVEITVLAQPSSTPQPAHPKPTTQPATNPNTASQPVADQNPVSQPVTKPTPQPVTDHQPNPSVGSDNQPESKPKLDPFCLSADQDSLSFSATVRTGNPDDQVVALSDGAWCQSGDWSASTDASWLDVSPHKGHLASGENAFINISASISDLKPGSYTGHIKLHPDSKVITVSLNVDLAPICISAKFDRISFIPNSHMSEGGWNIEQTPDRIVTIVNGDECRAGRWKVSSDAQWLTANPNDGRIDRGGSADVKVHVSSDGLKTDTLYIGHLTFEAGSRKTTITVYLRIASPVMLPLCLYSPTSSMTFTSLVSVPSGRSEYDSYGHLVVSQPADQKVTINNDKDKDCGEGNWTVSSDANWLVVKGGGYIKAGERADANVHIALDGLDPTKSPQTGHLTFSSKGSGSVVVTVYLNFNRITPPINSSPVLCEGIVARPDTLTFTSNVSVPAQGGWATFSRPGDQTATIIAGKDCSPADWTVSSDTNWLVVKGGGHIEATGTGNATVHASLDGLDASKTYTGHLTFQSGPNKATVTVNLELVKLTTQVTPQATPVIATPEPTRGKPTAEPIQVKPTSEPTQVVATPEPTQVIPTAEPTRVKPTAEPTQVIPTAEPTRVKPTAEPIRVIPTAEPTQVKPTAEPIRVIPTPVPVVVTQCISPNQTALAFNGDNGYKGYNPQAQTIVVTNCGSTGIVSAVASNDSSGWLYASGGGQVIAGNRAYISVSVDGIKSGLQPGPHSGTVYITIKTSDGNTKNVAVSVSFNVAHSSQPAPTQQPVQQPTQQQTQPTQSQSQPTQQPGEQPTQQLIPRQHGKSTQQQASG